MSEVLQVAKERKKRGPYKTYDDVTRLKIAKYSCDVIIRGFEKSGILETISDKY